MRRKINIEVDLTKGSEAMVFVWRSRGKGQGPTLYSYYLTPTNLRRLTEVANDMVVTGKGTILASETCWEWETEIV